MSVISPPRGHCRWNRVKRPALPPATPVSGRRHRADNRCQPPVAAGTALGVPVLRAAQQEAHARAVD